MPECSLSLVLIWLYRHVLKELFRHLSLGAHFSEYDQESRLQLLARCGLFRVENAVLQSTEDDLEELIQRTIKIHDVRRQSNGGLEHALSLTSLHEIFGVFHLKSHIRNRSHAQSTENDIPHRG